MALEGGKGASATKTNNVGLCCRHSRTFPLLPSLCPTVQAITHLHVYYIKNMYGFVPHPQPLRLETGIFPIFTGTCILLVTPLGIKFYGHLTTYIVIEVKI